MGAQIDALQGDKVKVVWSKSPQKSIVYLEKNNELITSLEMMLKDQDTIKDEHINILQEINDNLSVVCKNYGTNSIEDIFNQNLNSGI